MVLEIAGFLGGYLLGSVPTAYLLVKLRSNVDIRLAESGNVGAFNAFQVTRSRWTGILVGVLDGFKGMVPVLTASAIGASFTTTAIVLVGAVLGHNYPVWLKFKGGRGLATACGGLMVIGWAYIVVWCTTWAFAKVLKADILKA
ncbi:MAG: glycerol-3-phosphate acyltransferase, partial [Bacteroidota bacterium]